jgi:predicted RNA-binding protein YlxR (DUF448 family)
VGCGRVAPKRQLLRLAVAAEGPSVPPTVVIDRDGRMPGRGAYVCRETPDGVPRHSCLSQALTHKALARAFRRAVNVPTQLVESLGR